MPQENCIQWANDFTNSFNLPNNNSNHLIISQWLRDTDDKNVKLQTLSKDESGKWTTVNTEEFKIISPTLKGEEISFSGSKITNNIEVLYLNFYQASEKLEVYLPWIPIVDYGYNPPKIRLTENFKYYILEVL